MKLSVEVDHFKIGLVLNVSIFGNVSIFHMFTSAKTYISATKSGMETINPPSSMKSSAELGSYQTLSVLIV